MHFCFLAMLIGVDERMETINKVTSNHFSQAAKNQWTKIGVPELQDLLNRFYMNDEKS